MEGPEHPLFVNLDSAMPIYAQLVEQIARLVDSRSWEPGRHIPPVRALAIRLRINPMTVQKAYDVLKGEGYLRSRRGLGVFVVGPKARPAPEEFRKELRRLLMRGRQGGLSPRELREAAVEEISRLT